MSTTTELGFPHTSIGKCLLAAIAASPAQGHPLALLSLTTYLCVSNHLCLRIKPYSGNCLKLNRKQNKKHQHHIDPTQQLTKQGNKMKEKEQTRKERTDLDWMEEREGKRKKEKGEGEGKGMENWLLLTMARKRDLVRSLTKITSKASRLTSKSTVP